MASKTLPHAARKLYELPQQNTSVDKSSEISANQTEQDLLKYVRNSIIGAKKTFYSAFGTRTGKRHRVIYDIDKLANSRISFHDSILSIKVSYF